jgi:hypothetical protein
MASRSTATFCSISLRKADAADGALSHNRSEPRRPDGQSLFGCRRCRSRLHRLTMRLLSSAYQMSRLAPPACPSRDPPGGRRHTICPVGEPMQATLHDRADGGRRLHDAGTRAAT